ncbi:putative xaa-Pro aminopeptidase [Helianthus annuus]|nr:putative xaa-Pro aminopeptidase [Helianthus annuus]
MNYVEMVLLGVIYELAGSGANGAIIYYKAEPDSCSVVDKQKLFLLDSGAQYLDGTTDITRTVHFGEPSERQKECFTRVLQGHIPLDQAVFPENTPGFVLDAFGVLPYGKLDLITVMAVRVAGIRVQELKMKLGEGMLAGCGRS